MDYVFIEYGLIIISVIISAAAQFFINHNYKKYSKESNNYNVSGYETARRILDNNGLEHIKINQVSGTLSDFYDPQSKTVNLSDGVYNAKTVAAVSVAAHECGHAIQDKNGYLFLKIRRKLVPLVNIASYVGYIAVAVGFAFSALKLVELGILFEVIIFLFQVITLPVEFNASRRALKQIKELELLEQKEYKGGKKMLTSAALTYVAGVVSALAQVLRLVLILRRRDD